MFHDLRNHDTDQTLQIFSAYVFYSRCFSFLYANHVFNTKERAARVNMYIHQREPTVPVQLTLHQKQMPLPAEELLSVSSPIIYLNNP